MSQLPYLDKKQNTGGAVATTHITRAPDEAKDLSDGVGQELMDAIHRKDFTGIKESIRAILNLHNMKDE
jgi:hypothetical protein